MAAKLGLSLRLKNRFNYLNADRPNHALANVCRIVVLIEVVAQNSHQGLAEGAMMGTALGGVLAVDKGIVLLALASLRMGKSHFDVFAAQVNNLVHYLTAQVVGQKILEAVLGIILLAVEVNREARIQVDIIPNHPLDVLHLKAVVAKNGRVGRKHHLGTLPCGTGFSLAL